MAEEPGEMMRLGVVLMLTAALLSVMINVLGGSLLTLRNFTDKFSTAVGSGEQNSVMSLQQRAPVSGAICYSQILPSLGSIKKLEMMSADGTNDVWWDYSSADEEKRHPDEEKLMQLTTVHKNDMYIVHITRGSTQDLSTVTLEEVVRN